MSDEALRNPCLLAIGALALFVGCRSVAEYEPAPLPAPPTLLPRPGIDVPRAEAVETVPSHRLTLDEAIEEALTRGPSLRAAAEVVVQARADLRTASLWPNPGLDLATTLQPLPGTRFTPDNPGGPPQYTVDLGEPLDVLIFGKRSAAIASARRAVDVAGADLAEARRLRTAEVAATFFDVFETRALLGLARADLDDLRNVETLTRRRVELGGAPSIDVDRARLAAAASAQDVRTAETLHVGAIAVLRSLLGRSGPEPGFDVSGSLEVAVPLQPPDVEAMLQIAEEARPDLVSLRRQADRWEAEARLQRRLALPLLSARLGYLYQRQQPIGARDQNEWEASVSMSLPLFDRNQGNIAKAESQARQARNGLEAARAELRAELAQAMAAYRAAYAAVVADDKDQLDAAQGLRQRMEAAYREGGRNMLEVLDAERAWRDAQRLHIHVHSGYWHALHRLNAAVGAPILK